MGKEIIEIIRKKIREHFNYSDNSEVDENENFIVSCELMRDTPSRRGWRQRKYRFQILYQSSESDFKIINAYVMDEMAQLLEYITIDGQILRSPNLTAVQKEKGLVFFADYECEFETLKEKTAKMEDLDIEVEAQ